MWMSSNTLAHCLSLYWAAICFYTNQPCAVHYILRLVRWFYICDVVVVKQRWGPYLLSRAEWIVHYRWQAAKSINFILKFCHYLKMRKGDFSWLTFWLMMELRFDTMLYFNLGNENSDAGHIKCSRGPQAPTPVVKSCTLHF